jgi:uncharacterized membrane protein
MVAGLALKVHYSLETEPCSINAKWDCGVVNHSPYAEVRGIPVAAIGIAGYLALAYLGLRERRGLVMIAAMLGLGYSLYLTHIERDELRVWCLYCVGSLAVISLVTLLSLAWMFFPQKRTLTTVE